ncbi:hypothetical protein C4J88_4941 [Pseudomonas sp. R4-39-08]|nr:hypothetical protein C4J88_4941 [Pseudomonas sp. R4-39-08]
MHERIQGLRESTAAIRQRLVAPRTWLGSEGVNVLQVLGDVIDLLQEMNTALAAHKYGPTPPPDNATQFGTHAASAAARAWKLKPIIG